MRTGDLWNCTLHLPKATHTSATSFNYGTIIPAGYEPDDDFIHIVDSGYQNSKATVKTTGDVEITYTNSTGALINRVDTGHAYTTSWIISAQ